MPSDEFSLPRTVTEIIKLRGPTLRQFVLLIPVLGIVTSEMSLFYGQTGYALWGHLGTLLWCVLMPLWVRNEVTILQAFALVSSFRLVNLGMPVFVELTLFWLPLVYIPFIPVLYLLARSEPSIDLRFNLRVGVFLLPVGVFLGAILGEIEYGIIEPEALIPMWSIDHIALISIVMICFVGFVEEFLYRGVIQQTLATRYGRWPGIILTSALFGLMHSGYGVPVEMLFAGVLGVVFGLLYEYTDSLAFVTLLHGVINIFLFAVIPIQGSLLGVL